jgi:hypothetical protein
MVRLPGMRVQLALAGAVKTAVFRADTAGLLQAFAKSLPGSMEPDRQIVRRHA